MVIQQISMQHEIMGMVTFRDKVFFFTKDGLYYIDLPERKPWYRRAWDKLVRKAGKKYPPSARKD